MLHSLRKHFPPLLPVFLTYFLDNFGLAIVYPIFTPLFLNPTHPFFSAAATDIQRTILLGFLIGSFPLAQFFGAPLIGQFSDRFGRKKAFYFTILGTAVGYTFTAYGILHSNLPLLFASRFMTGLFAGNLTLCLASIADMSPDQQSRTKNFGSIAAIGGISFILAILIGGILADPRYSSHFNPSLPFWVTASLAYLNFILMILLYQETHPTRRVTGFHPFQGIRNLRLAIATPCFYLLYLINFFFMLSWVTSMQFFPTSLIRIFDYGTESITLGLVVVGITWSVSNLVVNRYFAKYFYPAKTLLIGLFIQSVCLFLLTIPLNPPFFFSCFYLAALSASLCWTNGLATISIKAPPAIQGSILGMNQSLTSVAAMGGPALGGIIVGLGNHTVFLFTGTCSLIGCILLYKSKIYKPLD